VLPRVSPHAASPSMCLCWFTQVDSQEYPQNDGRPKGLGGGLASRQTIVDTLGVGQHFGEISLITGRRRCASVVAVTYCELYSLSRADVDSVMDGFPDIATDFYRAAAENYSRWGLDEVRADSGVSRSGTNSPNRVDSQQSRGAEAPMALQAILAYQESRQRQRFSAHTPA
jgi:hypothetical protein